MSTPIIERLDELVVEGPANGLYCCDRRIFFDPDLFDLEMQHLFEGNWIYLAHETQIPNKQSQDHPCARAHCLAQPARTSARGDRVGDALEPADAMTTVGAPSA